MLATKEKSHPGFQLPTAALHPGFGFAISNTATEFDAALYDFRGGPRSSGYFRDSETGLDYANARYHQPGMGRFLSPDKYSSSAGASDPGSWNRYAYAGGDPIKFKDPRGRERCDPDEDDDCGCDADFCANGYGDGGGGGGGGGDETCDENPYQAQCSSGDDFQTIRYGNVPKRTIAISDSIMKMELTGAMALAKKMLAEDSCAKLFGLTGQFGNASPDPLTVLGQISNSFSFGNIADQVSGDTTTITSATTTGVGSSTISVGNGATMGVNASVSILLNNMSNYASFVTGSTYDQALTVLHELGHAYWDLYGMGTSAIGPDGKNTAASGANNDKVKGACK